MHPNWKALTTINFTYKKFVKASDIGGENAATNQNKDIKLQKQSGEEIQKFYEDVIQESVIKKEKIKCENVKIEKSENNKSEDYILIDDSEEDEADLSIIDLDCDRKLLTASQNGNNQEVSKLLKQGANMDCLDAFGWSPLMIAAAAGHEDLVNQFLSKGCSHEVRDKAGHSAADLARLKGNFKIENLILSWQEQKRNRIISRKEKSRKCKIEFESCDICHGLYDATKLKEHKVSLTHQLEMEKIAQESSNPGFIISEANKGYQLMKRSGWDGKSGLGTEQHKGRLFPVKSVLKRDRTGFQEGTRKAAKVTHFTANDKESIKSVNRDYHPKPIKMPTAARERQIRESLADL